MWTYQHERVKTDKSEKLTRTFKVLVLLNDCGGMWNECISVKKSCEFIAANC